MKFLIPVLLLLCQVQTLAQTPEEKYLVDSASVAKPGIPQGELLRFAFSESKIFPGTWRELTLYVPAQYRSGQTACVYVNQDGLMWNAPTVFDNLIQAGQMPVTIGIFITPGRVLADSGVKGLDRYNRSFEYDGLGDAYARFLLQEIFPEVEKRKTADGRTIRLSRNGNDCAIGGISSGAICAFTVAWEHPESFSRVFSTVGTYVGLRGGDRYPTLVRKYEPKPIRIFLQDGSSDLNIYAGDWWKANETMERALSFSGYEVRHVWGEGGHNSKQGTSVFPEAMRWLWQGWPAPVKKGASRNATLAGLTIPGEEWELVGEGYAFTEGTNTSPSGEVTFVDIPVSKLFHVTGTGKPEPDALDTRGASGAAFGPDGKRYLAAGKTRQIIREEGNGTVTVITDSLAGNDLVVAANGLIYVTAPAGVTNPGRIYLVGKDGSKKIVDEGIRFPNGLTLSPDQQQLYVTESASHWVWVFRIMKDGSLAYKQKFGWLHMADGDDNAWPDGLKCDTAGRVYVATKIGIQVLDQLGRVNAILPIPPSNGQSSNVCFGGPNLDILYVTAANKVFRRKLRTKGVPCFQAPIVPGIPRL